MSSPKKKARSTENAVPSAAKGSTLLLGIICFCAGALTMIIELAGNRLLAPIFGNSLYTWTALIGVILVAISAGDLLGGWLVDKYPRIVVLGKLLLFAASATAFIAPLCSWMEQSVSGMGLISGPLLLSLGLFALPACLLGAASPFIIRLLSQESDDRQIGLSAGLVGGLATLGSFVGTCAAGFYLIPSFGVRSILLGCAIACGAIGLVAIATFRERKEAMPLEIICLFLIATAIGGGATTLQYPPHVIWHQSTFYHDIQVLELTQEKGRARLMQQDTTLEGGFYLATGEPVFGYQQFWKLGPALVTNLQRSAFFGGGGFAMPERLSLALPQSEVHVVEIDPAVIDVGHRFFNLDQYPRVICHGQDARLWLKQSEGKFDLLFGDAYNGIRYVPAHLVTREFFTLVHDKLNPGGLYMMNLISAAVGPRAALGNTVVATLKSIFPHVEVFAGESSNLGTPQNLIILASDTDLLSRALNSPQSDDIQALLKHRVPPGILKPDGIPPLTDDHNPVEYLVAQQLQFDKGL